MLKFLRTCVISLIVIIPNAVFAQPATTYSAQSATAVFANCLVDNLNGKERKDLAKWIFFAMAAHPEIHQYLKASSKTVEASDKYVGKLITRLLTKNCPTELRRAHQADPRAIRAGFQLVGQVAMQELMTNQNVMKAITNYGKYTDEAKIDAILKDK